MTKSRRNGMCGILMVIWCGLTGGVPEAVAAPFFNGSAPAGFCLLSAGDLNADGLEDFAISRRTDGSTEQPAAYLFLAGQEPASVLPEPQDLLSGAAYILHGKAAAPFACSPPAPSAAHDLAASETPLVSRDSQPPPGVPATAITAPVYYAMVDLNRLSDVNYSYAYGLNAKGQVVGNYLNSQGRQSAYVFDGWDMHDLGTLGGHFSIAYDINAPGQIVGYSLTGETDASGWVNQAFLSDGFTMQGMGPKGGSATAINNAGQVAGDMRIDSVTVHASVYQDDTTTDIGTLDGLSSFALGINNRGQVVGQADSVVTETGQHATHAFLFSDGRMHDLGSLGYACRIDINGNPDCYEHSVASDINNRGQIAGHSTTTAGPTHAFLTARGTMLDLGTLGGSQSWANALNDSGQVVGTSLNRDDTAYHAFLYDQGTMYDLNQLIIEPADHPLLWSAQDINNFGQIVGVNYLLNPIYDKVTARNGYSARHLLGARLSFQYWGAADETVHCLNESSASALQVKVVVDGQAWPSPGLNRWVTVGTVPAGCELTGDWQQASLALPTDTLGKPATVKVRIRKTGRSPDSTVYLRHFRME